MRPNVIRAYALGIITGSFLTAGLITAIPAKAEPDGAAAAFAVVYGQIICDTLTTDHSSTTIEALGSAIVDEGLTWRQAGQVMVMAVNEFCPRNMHYLTDYVNAAGGHA